MIQINIPMPENCSKCPFFNNEYKTCPIVPMVPAMQKDVKNSANKRYKFCPLREVPEKKNYRLKVPEKCGKCSSMLSYGQKYYCHMDAISPKNPQQDISTIFVDPESKPIWCPISKINTTLSEMTPEKRSDFDKIMYGLSALFGNDNMMED